MNLAENASLRRKKVAEDERLQELSGRVEERRAAIQQLREALRGARAHNEQLEGAIEEVTIEKRYSIEHRAGKAACLAMAGGK
jgi:hypothetical protein